jgi:hypothetical protein
MTEETKKVRSKRMFVLLEVQSTVNSKELTYTFRELAVLGATVVQVHVNVAKKEDVTP